MTLGWEEGEKGRDVVHRDTGKFHGTRPVLNWLSKSALDLHQYKDGLGVNSLTSV